jgi:uncharacterized protein
MASRDARCAPFLQAWAWLTGRARSLHRIPRSPRIVSTPVVFQDAARGEDRQPAVAPTAPTEREPVLDVLRGVALLGILLINIEYMRTSSLYDSFVGGEAAPTTLADRVAQFGMGWLAAGKFLSMFAILFGIGAAMIAERAVRAGRSPRRLLARRYGLLVGLGLVHMVLLFPGDILFFYGLAGLALLAFVRVRAKTALRWGVGLVLAMTLLWAAGTAFVAFAPAPPADHPNAIAQQEFFADLQDQAVAAYTQGSYLDVVEANAFQSAILQVGQLAMLPWVLGLFLLGSAVGRAGVVADLAAHRPLLRRVAAVGLGVGLPVNLVLGPLGPLWGGATLQQGADNPGMLVVVAVVQLLGAPLLAAGYLAGVALLALRFGAPRRLAAVGRMALSAYLAQSVLALVVFAGFGLYDTLGSAAALLVVAGIWALLLIACPAWLRHFRYGPVEWLWRTATYGQRQPMRAG